MNDELWTKLRDAFGQSIWHERAQTLADIAARVVVDHFKEAGSSGDPTPPGGSASLDSASGDHGDLHLPNGLPAPNPTSADWTDAPPYGTCDWGGCNKEAVAWRRDTEHGRLPVCEDHRTAAPGASDAGDGYPAIYERNALRKALSATLRERDKYREALNLVVDVGLRSDAHPDVDLVGIARRALAADDSSGAEQGGGIGNDPGSDGTSVPAVEGAQSPSSPSDLLHPPRAAPDEPSGAPRWHVGRSWGGPGALEAACPCPKEPCGLVDMAKADPSCKEHPVGAGKTIRSSHEPSDCPGARDETGHDEGMCVCRGVGFVDGRKIHSMGCPAAMGERAAVEPSGAALGEHPCRKCGTVLADPLNLLDGYCKLCFVAYHPTKTEQEAALKGALDKLDAPDEKAVVSWKCSCGLLVAPRWGEPYIAKDGSVHSRETCYASDERPAADETSRERCGCACHYHPQGRHSGKCCDRTGEKFGNIWTEPTSEGPVTGPQDAEVPDVGGEQS